MTKGKKRNLEDILKAKKTAFRSSRDQCSGTKRDKRLHFSVGLGFGIGLGLDSGHELRLWLGLGLRCGNRE